MTGDSVSNFSFNEFRQSEFSLASKVEESKSNLIEGFYDDLESTICSCMAAGVSADKFALTQPQMVFDGNMATMECKIGFLPEVYR